MKKFLNLLTLIFIISLGGEAQTFDTNIDKNLSSWVICVKPSCNPGGSGIPSSESILETGASWPQNNLKISVTGPAYSNALFYSNAGATTATNFSSDFWILIPSSNNLGNIQTLEYDIFQYISPYRFMFGSQCEFGKKWQIWDALHGAWIDTQIDCTLKVGSHHIQWWVHRVDGDLSCDGFPCEHYDEVGIDGVYTKLGITEPAESIPTGWANQSGINFQIDISGVPTKNVTVVEYISNVNLVETN